MTLWWNDEQEKARRFIKREEKKARKEAEKSRKITRQEEQEAGLPQLIWKILFKKNPCKIPPLPEEELFGVEQIILPPADYNFPQLDDISQEHYAEDDVESRFSAKRPLDLNSQACNSLHLLNQRSIKRKENRSRISKILEETFAGLVLK